MIGRDRRLRVGPIGPDGRAACVVKHDLHQGGALVARTTPIHVVNLANARKLELLEDTDAVAADPRYIRLLTARDGPDRYPPGRLPQHPRDRCCMSMPHLAGSGPAAEAGRLRAALEELRTLVLDPSFTHPSFADPTPAHQSASLTRRDSTAQGRGRADHIMTFPIRSRFSRPPAASGIHGPGDLSVNLRPCPA